MKKIYTATLLLGSLALAACGQGEDNNTQALGADASAPSATAGGARLAQPSGEVHSGKGDITELSNDKVTISHGPVATLGWPAMTMTFESSSGELLQGLNIGDPVEFEFQKTGEQFVLTSIKKTQQ